MSRSKSKAFESVRREIARHLQAGLPLAGMIAATSLFCGCSERPPRGPIGKMPANEPPRCEQKSEQPKPKTQATPKKNGRNETKKHMPVGKMPAKDRNQANETKRPITPGRTVNPACK